MKILLAVLLTLGLVLSTVPAKADNSEEVIIGVLGGALGGLILGEVIGSNRDRVVERRVYVYEEPYEPYCYTRYDRVWSEYKHRYIKVKRVFCE